jgi:hypothetical protein
MNATVSLGTLETKNSLYVCLYATYVFVHLLRPEESPMV